MIQVSMTSPQGVTLDTGGKYCPDQVHVSPGFDFAPQAKRWLLEIPADITPDAVSSQPLLVDMWLAEHRTDMGLIVCLKPMQPPAITQGCTVVSAITANRGLTADRAGNQVYGVALYRMADADYVSTSPRYDSLTANNNVMELGVHPDGTLTLVMAGGYRLAAGNYCVTAWLM